MHNEIISCAIDFMFLMIVHGDFPIRDIELVLQWMQITQRLQYKFYGIYNEDFTEICPDSLFDIIDDIVSHAH